VFDLLEQTMNIPNLTRPEAAANIDSPKGLAERGTYVVPGTNALSLVLKSLASAKMTTAGIKYWNLMVRDYGIVPDMDSWMRLFGMLKVAKASAHAAEILDVVPDSLINPRIYRIAMETCVRDNINQNAIKNSNKALTSMVKRLEYPDPYSMRLYLRVALTTHYQLRSRSENGDLDGAKRDYGMQIAEALNTLWGPYCKLHKHFFQIDKAKDEKDQPIHGISPILYNSQREVIALARVMYSSYNKILQQGMLSDDDAKKIRPIGARINRTIRAFFANREEIEPNLRKSKGRGSAEEDMTAYGDSLGGVLGGDFEWDTTMAERPSKPARDERMRRRGEETPGSRWEERRDDENPRPRWEGRRGDENPRPRWEDRGGDENPRPRWEGRRSDENPRPRWEGRRGDENPRPRWEGRRGDENPRPRWEGRRGDENPRPRWEGRRSDSTPRERWEQHPDHRQPREFRGVRDPQQRRASLPW
jgi:pentatricopeptide repeat protein